MSVTSITITQGLINGTGNVLAVHSPLYFLAEAEEPSGDFPDTLTVNVKSGATTLATYNAYPYSEAGTKRKYIFRGDKVLRRFMLPLNDFEQVDDTVISPGYISRDFTIEATHESLTDSVDIVAYCAARQHGQTEAMTEIYNNDNEKAYSFSGRSFYVHRYGEGEPTEWSDTPLTFKVKTDNAGTSNDNQFTIPTANVFGVIYNYKVERCDAVGTVLETLENQSGSITLTWDSAGTYLVKIYPKSDGSGFPRLYFNDRYDKSKLIGVTWGGAIAWQSVDFGFAGCDNLVEMTGTPNLSGVASLFSLFAGATNFNQDIGGWNVSGVTNMSHVFKDATSFNQDISGWNVSSATSMFGMFQGATIFYQDLSGWSVPLIPSKPTDFDTDSGFEGETAMQPTWGV